MCLPLMALWGYSLTRCLRRALHGARGGVAPVEAAPLDDLTWALLILLSGWFGALADLVVMVLPRLHAPRRRLVLAGPHAPA